jgi:hypothetical protein
MDFVNCTPHAVALFRPDGESVTLPAAASPARCAQTTYVVGEVAGFPIHRVSFGAVDNLPPQADGTVYIASLLVVQAARAAGRADVFAVADTVRDDAGRIVGARALTDGQL